MTRSEDEPPVDPPPGSHAQKARFRDESGEEDLGNIDIFTAESDHYYLEGDWGSVEIESRERPRFLLTVM
jgi:hypothetical protein